MNASTEGDASSRTIASWALYDWGNSAFTMLVVTFVYATYFTQAFAPNEDVGTTWWSRGMALSALLVAVSSPILGALADRGGSRRRDQILATLICVGATAALAFVSPDGSRATVLALTVFVVALEVAAGLGAFLFGFIDDRVGGKATILFSLAALSLGTFVAMFGTSQTWLWAGGIIFGLFAGPNQSASGLETRVRKG